MFSTCCVEFGCGRIKKNNTKANAQICFRSNKKPTQKPTLKIDCGRIKIKQKPTLKLGRGRIKTTPKKPTHEFGCGRKKIFTQTSKMILRI